MEALVECFRCYYVERKIVAFIAAVALTLIVYFGLLNSSLSGFLVLIIALIVGVFGGNIIYVITSESFCNYCQSSNAFASNSRISAL